ncbi:hypothetical protein [Flavobacterium sp. J27]|uniref:hypothetical protein n=1 Tax=Flavobacterium sp. J27 TaxID=2060419 RepID=UPI0010315FF8|nr:hypothetical protein [Flavobacterium sp. J27]
MKSFIFFISSFFFLLSCESSTSDCTSDRHPYIIEERNLTNGFATMTYSDTISVGVTNSGYSIYSISSVKTTGNFPPGITVTFSDTNIYFNGTPTSFGVYDFTIITTVKSNSNDTNTILCNNSVSRSYQITIFSP